MRWWRMACVALLVVLGAGLLPGATPQAAAIGSWGRVAMPPGGAGLEPPALIVLVDGRVLLLRLAIDPQTQTRRVVAGRYNAMTNLWEATAAPEARGGFAAPVLLRDGSVLVSGGANDDALPESDRFVTAAAQFYDPAADRWTPTGALVQARAAHTATVLNDGTVLIVGGQTGTSYGLHQGIASAERFDPKRGQWSAAGALAAPRTGHTATLLADGRVLIVGGRSSDDTGEPNRDSLTAELFDPATGRWSRAADPLRTHGAGASATLLADGRVLLAGGETASARGTTRLGIVEIYDPANNAWTIADSTRGDIRRAATLLLPDGRVFAAGESTGTPTQIYDPARDLWTLDAPAPTYNSAIVALRDGRILLVGAELAALYNAPLDRACFPETGQCITGPFLTYWNGHGGLALNGYPLSGEQVEILEDGRAYTVQYFERSRLEYHPENGDPQFQILLGQFGRRVLSAAYARNYGGYQRATAPVAPLPGARFFAETGHNISPLFLAYWEANGGLAQFGYPITEERFDGLGAVPGVSCCKTQYFERARFEYHPENAGTPYEVLLGQFGRQLQADNAQLGPTFGSLYLANTAVRERLGAPRGPELTMSGAIQPFERGLMLYRGDRRQIFVGIGSQSAGGLVSRPNGSVSEAYWDDTWAEGQDPGGGAGPSVGLYLPQRGFGKLWREQGFRNDLGYATTASEVGYPMILQEFTAGYLLTVDGPNGRAIYVIYLQATGSHGAQTVGDYERVAER